MDKINYLKWIDETARKIVDLRLILSNAQKSSKKIDPKILLNAQAELNKMFEELRDGHEQKDILEAVNRIELGESKRPKKGQRKLRNKIRFNGGPKSASGGVGMYSFGRSLRLWR